MANTFTQIHLQLVFAVQYRASIIHQSWKDELYKYMTGIVQNHKHKLIIVSGMPDHVHLLIGMRPAQSLSELMQDIKGSSSTWINERKFTKTRFQWQEGYGAFSYSKRELPVIIDYIKNQEEHHRQKTFLEEYKELLQEFEIAFDEKYVFKMPE
jgi:REP element-mobilizing transposase RayT